MSHRNHHPVLCAPELCHSREIRVLESHYICPSEVACFISQHVFGSENQCPLLQCVLSALRSHQEQQFLGIQALA